MVEETRTPEEIQRSLHGTRRRIEEDLDELSRRMRSRSDSIPTWVKGASIAAAVFLMRRPLFKMVKAAATLSAPVVIPFVIGRIMERRSEERDGALAEEYGARSYGYGEESFGEGRTVTGATYSP